MSLIYEPKGKAREYSPLALNVYSGGCDHGCKYCYRSGIMRGAWGLDPRPRSLKDLEREAGLVSKQILMSFISDPYCSADVEHRVTRNALEILRASRCSVAILTKGGIRCLRDLDIFKSWPDARIKVGATLTFCSHFSSRHWEPGAALSDDRIAALRQLHGAGIKTWASIEPVIIPSESLAVIEASLPHVDAYKLGKWNHDARSDTIDWATFASMAVRMIRSAGKKLYVKNELRSYLPEGFLSADECSQDFLCLPERRQGGA